MLLPPTKDLNLSTLAEKNILPLVHLQRPRVFPSKIDDFGFEVDEEDEPDEEDVDGSLDDLASLGPVSRQSTSSSLASRPHNISSGNMARQTGANHPAARKTVDGYARLSPHVICLVNAFASAALRMQH